MDRWRKNDFVPDVVTRFFINEWSTEDFPDKYVARFKVPRLYFSHPFWFSIRRIRFIGEEKILEFDPLSAAAKPLDRLEQLFFHPDYMLSVKLEE